MNLVRVDYAGMGGACEGIKQTGHTPIGFEWDRNACATRAAAKHLTIQCDLTQYRTPQHDWVGYWASPPCQPFSLAGKQEGKNLLPVLHEIVAKEKWGSVHSLDNQTRHVVDAARTAVELSPEWIVMEQVPEVFPLWKTVAVMLERHGYSTWAGLLNAANYGVPQTRLRAILMASRTRTVTAPTPTHAEHPGMFGEKPWVSMMEALGWGDSMAGAVVDRRTTTRTHNKVVVPTIPVPVTKPAPTATTKGIASQWIILKENMEPFKFTVPETLVLQSFDRHYPVQGHKTYQFEQIGNAMPPRFAAHIVAALIGLDVPHLN